jgi:hypothetical protein
MILDTRNSKDNCGFGEVSTFDRTIKQRINKYENQITSKGMKEALRESNFTPKADNKSLITDES